MNVGDRVHVVRGPWEGYSGVVIGQETTGASAEPYWRVRLYHGPETLAPPSYFTKAKPSAVSQGCAHAYTEDANGPVCGKCGERG